MVSAQGEGYDIYDGNSSNSSSVRSCPEGLFMRTKLR